MIFFELARFNGAPNHPKLRDYIIRRTKNMVKSGHCVIIGGENAKVNIEALELYKDLPEDKVKLPNPYKK